MHALTIITPTAGCCARPYCPHPFTGCCARLDCFCLLFLPGLSSRWHAVGDFIPPVAELSLCILDSFYLVACLHSLLVTLRSISCIFFVFAGIRGSTLQLSDAVRDVLLSPVACFQFLTYNYYSYAFVFLLFLPFPAQHLPHATPINPSNTHSHPCQQKALPKKLTLNRFNVHARRDTMPSPARPTPDRHTGSPRCSLLEAHICTRATPIVRRKKMEKKLFDGNR